MTFKDRIGLGFRRLFRPEFAEIHARVQDTLYLQGRLLAQSHHVSNVPLQDRHFRVHSQFGEDGILQGILMTIAIPEARRMFLEIGVGDYSEANTAFLLFGCSFRGSIVDSCAESLAIARATIPLWRYPLLIADDRVTTENINEVVARVSSPENLGVLSIDVDGNDYWLWENLRGTTPDVVIIEYNALWGPDAAVSVPYSPEFDRFKEHFSGLFWGSSLRALSNLAQRKGYQLVATSDGGNNAFFVHTKHQHLFPPKTVRELFRPAAAREARSQNGTLSFLLPDQLLDLLAPKKLIDQLDGQLKTVDSAIR